MAAFHFVISPPTRKPSSKKIEEITEKIPRLILAPFNSTPEIQFGEVLVNSKSAKSLIICNPSMNIPFVVRFGNIDADDRIFINGCDINTCEVHLQAREEIEVEITWSPILSGYLRKTIRIYDVSKKARSFDVVLRGMAVNNGNDTKNPKFKKLKKVHKVNQVLEKDNFSSTVLTANYKKNDTMNTIRRQTYTINGKENSAPNSANNVDCISKSSSPIFSKESSSLNVLHENSIVTNFSVQSFPSYDSVDAPIKYSNFKSELELSVSMTSDLNSVNSRRSTVLHSAPCKNDVNLSSMHDKNLISNLSGNLFSTNLTNGLDVDADISTPIRHDNFLDSLNKDSSLGPEAGNLTFNMQNRESVDVFLTPHKNLSLDGLILSPTSTSRLENSSPFLSKSSDCLNHINGSSFKSYKRDDLFFISPPQKSLNKRLKKSSEDLFPHRSGSSAISDRKKLLKTSFLSRKKLSPNSAIKNRGPRRISAFGYGNVSTVEKVKSRNPQTLKQAVSSHCQINDPFLKQVLYNEDKWAEKQEKDIIKWINSVLMPPQELSEESNDWTVNAADVWLKVNRSDENSVIPATNKIPPLYSVPQKLHILRKRKNNILNIDPVKSVFQNLARIVDRKTISVRDDRDLHADEGLKKKLLHLLSCYNPIWLRLGLEAVYEREITFQPKADIGGLGLFIRKNLLSSALVNKRNANLKHENVKKSMLLTFLKLVYFLDQARIQKLIRHNRCLFTLDSRFKSSQDILSAFCADLIVGRRYVMNHLKSINYTLHFKQTCIDEYNYSIKSLDDLKDGVRLTRLFEILFMEADLCLKLRVPAIDIENKKHNVEVAMKIARSRCTIEGNITPEDIVLGNRAGSRMKTLSFLWQIINNYLKPLHERAAVKIQRWWRVRRMHYLLKNFVQREKEKSALIIQSTWRGFQVRKQLREKILEYKRVNRAALIIQNRFRAFLTMKREKAVFNQIFTASVTLQCWYRCISARRKFVKLRNAVVVVQRRYRAIKLMTECRNRFLCLKNWTIFLQRLRRANVTMRPCRKRFLSLKRAAVTIQQAYRRTKLFRNERNYYLSLRSNVINVQRRFRANRAMKLNSQEYILLKKKTLIIQRRFRSKRVLLQIRNDYLNLKNAVIQIQRRFRANQLMRVEREKLLTLKQIALIIQRKFRATQLMKSDRSRFVLLKHYTIKIQRLLRANQKARVQRCEYLNLKYATIFIQRKIRAMNATKIERRNFLALRASTVIVQRRYRANRAMKIERNNFLQMLRSATFIQQVFRANKIVKNTRMDYLRTKSAVLFIQSKYRAQKAMIKERQQFLLLKQSAICIQQKFRANQSMKFERSRYTKLLRTVIFVQKKFRANKLFELQRRRFLNLRNAAVVIQQKFRAKRSMQLQRSEFLALKTSVTAIQQRFRANQSAKFQRSNFIHLRKVVIFIQQKFRANKITYTIRHEYLQLKKSVIFVQTRYRSLRLMRQQRSYFIKLRYHTIIIQRLYRGLKFLRIERKKYETQRKAAVVIQRRFRARCLMREARSYYLKLKNLTIFIQKHFIAVREMRSNIGMKNLKSLRFSNITKVGPLQLQKYSYEQLNNFNEMLKLRNEFLKLKMCVTFVQALYKMKKQRNKFQRMKMASVRIQRWWRSIRERQLMIRDAEEKIRCMEVAAATKIQSLWRGFNVRKKIILRAKPVIVTKKDKENPDSIGTLGERYKRAIDYLKTSDMYNVITAALWNLETVTTFSSKLCEGVAREGIVPIIFSIIYRGNRSEPSIELYRASFSILINLARYAPTKVILWEQMDKDADVLQILHIMKMTCDKFFKKNDVEVFRNSATLLWLLCQDTPVARRIACVNTLHFQLQKMMETINRKCLCKKNPKTYRCRTLPKTESNWYAHPESRTFKDNCFALSCIYNSLFNR